MNIPPSIGPLIQGHMDSGLYGSVEELLHKALTRLEDETEGIDELRAMVQEGLDELERGDSLSAEEVFANLRALQASFHEQNGRTA